MALDITRMQPMLMGYNGMARIWTYNCGAESFATVATTGYFNNLLNTSQTSLVFPGVPNTGDKLFVTTSTNGLSFSGTFRVDTVNSVIYVDWDREFIFTAQMADVSTASTVYFNAPAAGVITQVFGTLWSAVTVASSIVTFSIGGTPITGGTFTVTTAGIAGQFYNATPTAANTTSGSNVVSAASDGGSTTTAIMTLGYKIICPTQA